MYCSDPVYTLSKWFPDRVAIYFWDHVVTYLDLHLEIERARAKVRVSSWAIAYPVENNFQAIVLLWASLREGKVFFPINPKFPESVTFNLLKQSESEFSKKQVFSLDHEKNDVCLSLDQPATLVATSGSTGSSKLVVHSLRNHMASAQASQACIPFGLGDKWLLTVPLFHVSGLSIVFRTFFSGASLVLSDFSKSLEQSLFYFQPTHLSVVPTQLLSLSASGDFSFLKHVLVGGASVSSTLIETFSKLFPIHLTYGLTEMSSQVVTDNYLLSSADLKIDPVSDEILVRGNALCLGYYANGFIRLSLTSDGWFRTKDRGRWVENRFEVLGRLDRMFISGGENIYPEEIENVAMGFDGVVLANVSVIEDMKFGKRPILHYFSHQYLDENAFKDYLNLYLPRFKFPVAIDFIGDYDLYIKKFRCK